MKINIYLLYTLDSGRCRITNEGEQTLVLRRHSLGVVQSPSQRTRLLYNQSSKVNEPFFESFRFRNKLLIEKNL